MTSWAEEPQPRERIESPEEMAAKNEGLADSLMARKPIGEAALESSGVKEPAAEKPQLRVVENPEEPSQTGETNAA